MLRGSCGPLSAFVPWGILAALSHLLLSPPSALSLDPLSYSYPALILLGLGRTEGFIYMPKCLEVTNETAMAQPPFTPRLWSSLPGMCYPQASPDGHYQLRQGRVELGQCPIHLGMGTLLGRRQADHPSAPSHFSNLGFPGHPNPLSKHHCEAENGGNTIMGNLGCLDSLSGDLEQPI